MYLSCTTEYQFIFVNEYNFGKPVVNLSAEIAKLPNRNTCLGDDSNHYKYEKYIPQKHTARIVGTKHRVIVCIS